MLPGIRVQNIERMVDERGFFAELMREDWTSFLNDDKIAQTNLSFSQPGTIRAWHRHNLGQIDYIIVLKGIMKICAYDDQERSPTKGQLSEIIASDQRPQVVRIPGNYWHGTKTIGTETSLALYLVTRLYDPKNPDEDRRSWNDPTIRNPRTSMPFDWNELSHR